MSDSTDTGDMSIECTFRPFDSGEVILRQVALGMTPIVLMEPEMDGEDVTFKIDATGIEREELAQLLTVIASTLAREEGDQ